MNLPLSESEKPIPSVNVEDIKQEMVKRFCEIVIQILSSPQAINDAVIYRAGFKKDDHPVGLDLKTFTSTGEIDSQYKGDHKISIDDRIFKSITIEQLKHLSPRDQLILSSVIYKAEAEVGIEFKTKIASLQEEFDSVHDPNKGTVPEELRQRQFEVESLVVAINENLKTFGKNLYPTLQFGLEYKNNFPQPTPAFLESLQNNFNPIEKTIQLLDSLNEKFKQIFDNPDNPNTPSKRHFKLFSKSAKQSQYSEDQLTAMRVYQDAFLNAIENLRPAAVRHELGDLTKYPIVSFKEHPITKEVKDLVKGKEPVHRPSKH